MRVRMIGGRFGRKALDSMMKEDHLFALIQALIDRGASVHSFDDRSNVDVEVHIEVQRRARRRASRVVCIQLENEFIWPPNTLGNLLRYDHLITWDRSITGRSVSHIFPPVADRAPIVKGWEDRPVLASLVATNRAENRRTDAELYSERVRIIRFFEEMESCCFELWGHGWNLPVQPRGVLFSGLFKLLRKIPIRIVKLRNYMGPCLTKDAVLENSLFNFAFENAKGFEGYVTEKIFDSLIAGAVPIYVGCKDISDYVPSECFWHYEVGCDLSDLVTQMRSYTSAQYAEFDRARLAFLRSETFSRHLIQSFAAEAAFAVAGVASRDDRAPPSTP